MFGPPAARRALGCPQPVPQSTLPRMVSDFLRPTRRPLKTCSASRRQVRASARTQTALPLSTGVRVGGREPKHRVRRTSSTLDVPPRSTNAHLPSRPRTGPVRPQPSSFTATLMVAPERVRLSRPRVLDASTDPHPLNDFPPGLRPLQTPRPKKVAPQRSPTSIRTQFPAGTASPTVVPVSRNFFPSSRGDPAEAGAGHGPPRMWALSHPNPAGGGSRSRRPRILLGSRRTCGSHHDHRRQAAGRRRSIPHGRIYVNSMAWTRRSCRPPTARSAQLAAASRALIHKQQLHAPIALRRISTLPP